jgi:formiminoglutamase
MNYKSKQGNFSFELADHSWKSDTKRVGENKISSTLKFGSNTQSSKYLLIGISEDIGPQMNGGFQGANIGFTNFLSAFQNVQSNSFLTGSEVGVLGEFKQQFEFISIEKSKGWIEELDDFILDILKEHTSKNQILIAIGGGHNNAYPLLKHIKQSNGNEIHAINIDPHADCRPTDYRHSGNPFSFAFTNSVIDKYSVIGLHESYNNEAILNFLSHQSVGASFFEEFLDDEIAFWKNIDLLSKNWDQNIDYTLDLDIDSIAFAPSSALTPSGFSIEDCRKIIRKLSSSIQFKYLHLPEGAPQSELEKRNYAKMLTYFVVDFIKCQNTLIN